MADHLEDDFVPDELTALSDNEGIALHDETASLSAQDESPSLPTTSAKKRKRREKEKEKKAKVSLIPL